MVEPPIWNIILSFSVLILCMAILKSKSLILNSYSVPTNQTAQKIMSNMPRWAMRDPAAHLMVHCASHTLNDDVPVPEMDELSFYERTHTSMLKGKIGDRNIIVKVWRGTHMGEGLKRKFTQTLSRELDLWKRATHPNVAPFFGVVSGFGFLPSLILPYYSNGNMNEYLANNPKADVLHILGGVAEALTYMHSLTPPVVHGGVRGSNILITDAGDAQLSDVSICNMPHSPDLTYTSGELLGTRWMAPEVIDPDGEITWGEDEKYETPRSDVYSFGMTVLEAYTRHYPFAHRRFHAGVIFDVVQGHRPPRPVACPELTDSVWNLTESCWNHDQYKRPPIRTVRAWIRLLALVKISGVSCSESDIRWGKEGLP